MIKIYLVLKTPTSAFQQTRETATNARVTFYFGIKPQQQQQQHSSIVSVLFLLQFCLPYIEHFQVMRYAKLQTLRTVHQLVPQAAII